jgi:hypothetical protein
VREGAYVTYARPKIDSAPLAMNVTSGQHKRKLRPIKLGNEILL